MRDLELALLCPRRMKTLRLALLAALLVPACDVESGDDGADGARGPTGKADEAGSCADADADACGGESPSGCFCDAQCVQNGDCCADVEEVCGIQPEPFSQCTDGTFPACEIVPPTCGPGLVLSVQNGCFGPCVDPSTCEPPAAPEPFSPCTDGTFPLCEIVPPICPPTLVLSVQDGCFGPCVDPSTCEPPAAPEPFSPCTDGTFPLCEIVPPTCPSGLVLSVHNSCFGPCVDPDTCEPPA